MMYRNNHITRFLLLLFTVLLVNACSVRRHIPTNEVLYKSGSIHINTDGENEAPDEVKSELEELLRPDPNSKILGARLGLLVHYKAQRKKPGFLNKYLNKKIGEEPVYLSDVDTSRTIDLIHNRLENNGYFQVSIAPSVKQKKKLASVNYTVTVGTPYLLEKYTLDSGNLPIHREIEAAMADSDIKQGSRFNLDLLKAERERIDTYLKAKGYYNFNADFLIFEADTNQYNDRRFDLFVRLKKDVPRKSLYPYELRNINVYPNNTIDTGVKDTVTIDSIRFIQNPEFFRPDRMAPYILFKPGQRYDPQKSRLTGNRLSSIGSYEFINIRYESVNPDDTVSQVYQLDANIALSPLKKRSLRAELRAVTKSNGFAGPALAVVHSNLNQFRGGETLNITGSFGYEVQLGGSSNSGLSSTQFGLKTDLIFPRLLLPFKVTDTFLYAVPKTKLSLGFDFFDRGDLYSLNSLIGTFGYSWRKSRSVYHEINPISINYVNTSNITDDFQTILDQNPFLQSSFQQQLITGITYTFVYNQLTNLRKRNPVLLTANIDIAGNVLDLVSTATNENGKKTLFDIEYAQYSKADINFVYQYRLNSSQQLVGRFFGGVGLPYGNSEALPFSRQFFSGGPSSVRAFRTRSLGPGSYSPDANDQGSFFDRSGDIRLEANVEYRFPIYSYLKGALFADAGNVWLTKENTALPGARFSSDFINQLGVGMGFGLRVDVQNFVIRFDLAAPLSKPYLPKGERFDFDLSNPMFNFAIGYPF